MTEVDSFLATSGALKGALDMVRREVVWGLVERGGGEVLMQVLQAGQGSQEV